MTTLGPILCPSQFCLLTKQLQYKPREYEDTHFGKTKSTVTESYQPTDLKKRPDNPNFWVDHHIYSSDFKRNQFWLEMKSQPVLRFTLPQRGQSPHPPFPNSPQTQVQAKKNNAFTMLMRLQLTDLTFPNRLVAPSPCSIESREPMPPCKGHKQ